MKCDERACACACAMCMYSRILCACGWWACSIYNCAYLQMERKNERVKMSERAWGDWTHSHVRSLCAPQLTWARKVGCDKTHYFIGLKRAIYFLIETEYCRSIVETIAVVRMSQQISISICSRITIRIWVCGVCMRSSSLNVADKRSIWTTVQIEMYWCALCALTHVMAWVFSWFSFLCFWFHYIQSCCVCVMHMQYA